MDLRTKLVFALVVVALGSMLALGALAYTLASDLLTEKTLRQLVSLAEAKKQELEEVVLGWQDRVALIASRTQLRLSLRAINQEEDAEHPLRIERILSDARASSAAVERLAVYDIDNRLVASVGSEPDSEIATLDPSRLPEPGDTVSPPEIFFTEEAEPRASFLATLRVEGERVGALRVVLNGGDLNELIRNFTGLGETGETMIVLRDSAGVERVLQPLRGLEPAPQVPVQPKGANDPAAWAIAGRDSVAQGLIDYRGQPVWAATRFLPEVGWGVVVKFDAAEEMEAIHEFRSRLTQLGLSLSAFAILLGTLLGLRFAKPIHDLAGVANEIRLGELSARADTKREDELGLLARTFNQMAEELERQVTLLHEFQKYFEVSRDMLCIAGTDGYFKRVNPAFERTLGWTSEELLSRPFVEFVHPDDVDKTLREIEKLARGEPTTSFTNRYRCADGSWKRLEWTAHPEPELARIYAIARDITQPDGANRSGAAGDSQAAADV